MRCECRFYFGRFLNDVGLFSARRVAFSLAFLLMKLLELQWQRYDEGLRKQKTLVCCARHRGIHLRGLLAVPSDGGVRR